MEDKTTFIITPMINHLLPSIWERVRANSFSEMKLLWSKNPKENSFIYEEDDDDYGPFKMITKAQEQKLEQAEV